MLRTFIALFFSFSLISSSMGQAMSGNYTIGGSNGNYPDFSAAVSAISTNGVNGAVTFYVRPGTYNEQITINSISGATENNSITFTSETFDADDVSLEHRHSSSSSSENFTLKILNAKHIKVKNIRIRAIRNQDFNKVIEIDNSAEYILLDSLQIISWNESNQSLNQNDAVTISNSSHIDILHSFIRGGNTGLHFTSNNSSSNWKAEGNKLIEQYQKGIELTQGSKAKILSNVISSQRNNSNVTYSAISLDQFQDSLLIEANQVQSNSGGSGIKFNNCNSIGEKGFMVNNNMITVGDPGSSSNSQRGIDCLSNDTISFFHNSFLLEGNNGFGEVFYSSGNNSFIIYNNNMSHSGGGIMYYSQSLSNPNIRADHNNYYTPASIFAIIANSTYNSLNQMQSQRMIDSSSLTADPKYMRRDLLIATNNSLLGQGTPISEVNTDLFGNLRSATSPNIGAYEGSLPTIDAGIAKTNIANVNSSCTGDSIEISVNIVNNGSDTLFGADINLEFASANETISWTGILAPQDTSAALSFSKVASSSALFDNWKVWTSNPNNASDSFPLNDTLSGQIKNNMGGHYIIGPSASADFPDLSTALNELDSRVICDTVFFNVEAGNYNQQLTIGHYGGLSQSRPLVIQSLNRDSTSVQFTHSANTNNNNYIFRIDGTENLILRHLGFRATGTYYGTAILFDYNGANNITLANNHIRSVYGFNSRQRSSVNFRSGNNVDIDNIKITNNYFEEGSYQIYVKGNANNKHENILIEKNQFWNGPTNIWIEHCKNVEISSNKMSGLSYLSLQIAFMADGITVNNNQFNLAELSSSIRAIDVNNSLSTASNPLNIYNNFITMDANTATALTVYNASNLNIYHNSIHSIQGDRNMVRIRGTSTADINLKNNIFFSSANAGFYYTDVTTNLQEISSDYNSFYTNDSIYHEIDGLDQTLADWQTATSNDLNSIVADPWFANDTDLHVVNTIPFESKGTPIPFIQTDIDGEARVGIPDIGADEFSNDSSNYFDLAINGFPDYAYGNCQKTDSIFVTIRNRSSFTIDSFVTVWSTYSTILDSSWHYDSIPSKDTLNVFLGTFDVSRNTPYYFNVKVDLPNGMQDSDPNNDSEQLKIETLSGIKIYKKEVAHCSTATELFIRSLPHQSIQWSNNSTQQSISVSGGTYSVTLIDNNGCIHTDTITVQ